MHSKAFTNINELLRTSERFSGKMGKLMQRFAAFVCFGEREAALLLKQNKAMERGIDAI